MGKELEKIFLIVEEKKGNNGRIRLSQMSKITKKIASELDDDLAMVDSLKKKASELIGEDIDKFL